MADLKNLLCLSTQAFGFGTGLRTTRLKTVPQTVFFTTRALSGFDSPLSSDIKKQGSIFVLPCFLVEMRGIEPLSENAFTKLSPSAVIC